MYIKEILFNEKPSGLIVMSWEILNLVMKKKFKEENK